MVDIILKDGETGYEAVGEYIKRYWEHNPRDAVLFSVAVIYDSGTSGLYTEAAYPSDYDPAGIMYDTDWWEGEKHIILYGIVSFYEIPISGGIYAE